MELYDYQNDLVDRARQAYVDGYKAPCIVSPCGSGKSIMVAEIAKRTTRKGNRVLFLVHRRELIDQIKDTFQKMGVDNQLVNFGMVQTVVRHLETIKKTPDLLTWDSDADYQRMDLSHARQCGDV